MRLTRFAALFAATAALFQVGCGDDSEEGNAASGEAAVAAFGPEDVTVGGLLAQVRGHHRAALERYEARDREAALEHARHPADEVLDSLRPELEEHGAGTTQALARSLGRVTAAIRAREPAAEVRARIDEAGAQTRRAEREVVGEAADADAYRGSVIASLASVAAHEYEEALDDGRIARLDEYQDGFGFTREAAAMYRGIAPAVEEQSAEEAAEIEEAFEALERAMPSGSAPARPASLEDVERNAALIGAELEETVGAEPVAESDPEDVRERIDALLDEVVRTYEPGHEADAAAELVAEAYLENYELIEAAVIDAAPEVNAELEPLLGAELRRRIREGAAPEVIAGMAKRAKQLLAQAVRAVEGAE